MSTNINMKRKGSLLCNFTWIIGYIFPSPHYFRYAKVPCIAESTVAVRWQARFDLLQPIIHR
jgi:hypothetical protein